MKRGFYYLIILLAVGLLGMYGCPKKTEVTSAPEPAAEAAKAAPKEGALQAETSTSGESSKRVEPAGQPQETGEERSGVAAGGLKPVYFDYDKSFVRDDQKDAIRADAAWLKAHPRAKITIEGNCDERGTREYNQALGQRRAASAKKYLTALGVAGSRISLISYGKEKPVCTESTETCWQKNRRDDFVAAAN